MSEEPITPIATLTIARSHYEHLVKDSEFLARLRAAGVDNWDGYHMGFPDSDEEDDE